jgi:hypothetical protein
MCDFSNARLSKRLNLQSVQKMQWVAITASVPASERFVVAMVCRAFAQAIGPTRTDGRAVVSSVDRCRWMLRQGCPWGDRIAWLSARHGALDVLVRAAELEESTSPWEDRVCGAAARAGHLRELRWAATRYPIDAALMADAAAGGHLHVLAWGRRRGLHVDDYACTAAAQTGQIAALEWLVARGCRPSPTARELACPAAAAWLEARETWEAREALELALSAK